MKKWTILCFAVLLTSLALVAIADHHEGATWTGEVVDVACYVSNGDSGRGADHAKCAKSCVKAGQPMGLLTADGALVMLAADHADGAPFEALKDLAGETAEIGGTLSERNGVKMVTVKSAKKAG